MLQSMLHVVQVCRIRAPRPWSNATDTGCDWRWAIAPLGVSWKLAVASLTGCSFRMPIQAQFDVSMRARVGCYSMCPCCSSLPYVPTQHSQSLRAW